MKKHNEMGSFAGNSNADSQYAEALEYLYSRLPMFSRVGGAAYKPGLQTSIDLDNAFGNPHNKFKSIHIAGTNGKGSVSHTLAAILQSQGYKVALYTSPHLADFRERIRINGEMIPKHSVVEFVEKWKNNSLNLTPSFFELTMMMAFDWFAKENVDYAVIEVGMGGRLDSTNIITPEACVITNISNDHNQFLGSTPQEIAFEKAGIIKHNIPVTIGEASGLVKQVFQDKISEVETTAYFAEENPEFSECHDIPEGGWILSAADYGDIKFALAGDYQTRNANTILKAVKMLRNCNIEISYNAVINGMANVEKLTGLRGRWTRIADNPLTICDTGHNEAGLNYNMAQLQRILSTRNSNASLRIVVGFVADKAIDKILKLFPQNAKYYFCNPAIPRALPAEELAQKANSQNLKGEYYPDVASAYNAALEDATPDDIIFVGGSTFIVADFLIYLDSK